ncbi:Galactose mutarotase-like superfamily protein [Euphorbia peplus]|nr:Galactose mutarotase-like superfamily protein [Euphorbia peplus]
MADLFVLNNGSMIVKITNLGCTITSLSIPDKNGNLADVVLGFDSLEPYLKGAAPYFGEEKDGLKRAARLKDPSSSRVLNLWTNAPGMQFYTANYVNGVVGKGGATYGKQSAACLETQAFPNAVNQLNFPSVIVQPGETYKHTMLYEFSVE